MASVGLDQQAWVLSIVEQFEVRLTRYAQRITRDEDLARDVVQFVFMRLCDTALCADGAQGDRAQGDRAQGDGPSKSNSEGARGIKNIGQWLYAVCRNRAIDLLRRNKRMQSLDSQPDRDSDGAWPFSSNGHARHADPVATAEVHDSAALVRKILATLPEPQQEVIDLWADGFSYVEISEITQRTEVNVRVIVHRAFKAVREHPMAKELRA